MVFLPVFLAYMQIVEDLFFLGNEVFCPLDIVIVRIGIPTEHDGILHAPVQSINLLEKIVPVAAMGAGGGIQEKFSGLTAFPEAVDFAPQSNALVHPGPGAVAHGEPQVGHIDHSLPV